MNHFLNFALDVARKAGEQIKKRVHTDNKIEIKQSAFDLVTEVDQDIEKYINSQIQSAYPTHFIIGEEDYFSKGNKANLTTLPDYVWYVDPLDGTTNFVHGLPGYTVSIALAFKNKVCVGVIYSPETQEMFWAESGKGAFLNDNRIQVSSRQLLKECVVATGFPVEASARNECLNQILAIGPISRNVRSLGSAALHMAYVATGRLDGYWESGIHPWDVVAGWFIIQEAGGRISGLDGASYQLSNTRILATNGMIHQEMLDQLHNPVGS